MYREAESLAKANYDESVCDGSVVSRSKNKQGTKKKGGEQEKQQLEVAEKGWIKLATKMNTHNYHLKNAQNASSAALKVK